MKTYKKMKKILAYISAGLIIGCNSGYENQQPAYEPTETMPAAPVEEEAVYDPINSPQNTQEPIILTQYYFVVLNIVEDHVFEKKKSFYVTSINELSYYNDEIKYKILDDVVMQYKSSPSGIAYNGSIKKREIFTFFSYEEASKAREEYIMN